MGNVASMRKNVNQNGYGGSGTWMYRYRPRWEDNIKASLKE